MFDSSKYELKLDFFKKGDTTYETQCNTYIRVYTASETGYGISAILIAQILSISHISERGEKERRDLTNHKDDLPDLINVVTQEL